MDCPDQGERYHGGVIAGRRQALGAHSRSERDSTLIDGLEQSRFIGQLYDPARRTKKLNDRSWPILLKKSVDALDPIFSAPLARFHNEDAEGLIARRRRDVDRSKWNCEASNSRS
jgi:hypothetical protein